MRFLGKPSIPITSKPAAPPKASVDDLVGGNAVTDELMLAVGAGPGFSATCFTMWLDGLTIELVKRTSNWPVSGNRG